MIWKKYRITGFVHSIVNHAFSLVVPDGKTTKDKESLKVRQAAADIFFWLGVSVNLAIIEYTTCLWNTRRLVTSISLADLFYPIKFILAFSDYCYKEMKSERPFCKIKLFIIYPWSFLPKTILLTIMMKKYQKFEKPLK